MKNAFGYLVGFLLVLFPWGTSYFFYINNEPMGAMTAFVVGIPFAGIFLYAIFYYSNLASKKALVEEHHIVVMADLDSIKTFDGINYMVHVLWRDDNNHQYIFTSEPIKFNPERFIEGRQIPVKLNPNDYSIYVVDLSFLPNVVQ